MDETQHPPASDDGTPPASLSPTWRRPRRFYRTVLCVLGVEPSHADAELVEWEDWDIGLTDREHRA